MVKCSFWNDASGLGAFPMIPEPGQKPPLSEVTIWCHFRANQSGAASHRGRAKR